MSTPTKTNGTLAVIVTLAGTGLLAVGTGLGVQVAIALVGVAYVGIGTTLLTTGGLLRDGAGSTLVHLGFLAVSVGVLAGAGTGLPNGLEVGLLTLAVTGVAVGVTTRSDVGLGRPIAGGLAAGSLLAFVATAAVVGGRVVLDLVVDLVAVGVAGVTARPLAWILLAAGLLVVGAGLLPSSVEAALLVVPTPKRRALYSEERRTRLGRAAERFQWVVLLTGVAVALTMPAVETWRGLLDGLPAALRGLVPNPATLGPPGFVGDPAALGAIALPCGLALLPLVVRRVAVAIDRTRFRATIREGRYAVGSLAVATVVILAVGPYGNTLRRALPPAATEALSTTLDSIGSAGVALGLTTFVLFAWALIVGLALTVRGAGVLPRRSAGIAAGAGSLFLGGLVGSQLGASTTVVTAVVIASLAAWDLGEHAADLGSTVPAGADTAQVELVHAAGTLGVGICAAVATAIVARSGPGLVAGASPEAALIAALAGIGGLVLTIRLLRG